MVHPGPGLVDPALLHDLLVPVCKRNFLIHCPTHLNHCPHTSQYCPTHLKRCLLKLCVCVDACLLDVVRYRRASRGPLPDPLGVDVAMRNLSFPQDRSSGHQAGHQGVQEGVGALKRCLWDTQPPPPWDSGTPKVLLSSIQSQEELQVVAALRNHLFPTRQVREVRGAREVSSIRWVWCLLSIVTDSREVARPSHCCVPF